MGATGFSEYHSGKDMRDTYRMAVEQARYEYGADGYNGSISTTSGVRQTVREPMTLSGAQLYADAHIDTDGEKWGAACAIPIADDEHFTLAEVQFTVTAPVELDVLDWDNKPIGKRPTTRHDLDLKCRAAAMERFGMKLHSVQVRPTFRAKARVMQPEGRATTVYVVNNKQFPTKTAAVAEAKKHLDATDYIDRVAVKAIKVWGGSESAAVVQRVTTTALATVIATTAVPKPGIAIKGWMFYGWAAC